jgi:hypothetical protein
MDYDKWDMIYIYGIHQKMGYMGYSRSLMEDKWDMIGKHLRKSTLDGGLILFRSLGKS